MNTIFIGQNLIEIKSIDSTNNYAAQLSRQSVMPEGTVVAAEEQTKGRGQRGNSWESEAKKNLTFSTILYPKFLKADEQFYLTKAVSLAICDFLPTLLPVNLKIKIKWPNDIYIEGKKIAGILIENSVRENQIQHTIVGIGLNINQQNFKTENTVSVSSITEKEYPVNECLEQLCSFLEVRYLKLKKNNRCFDEEYLSSLYQCEEMKSYLFKGEKTIAKIVDVTAEGLLVLEKKNSEKIYCNLKEVTFFQ
ncbi:MAG: biotin--[acetyl-CoA-carboxylase] ligase [Flavobacteriales bacterium]|nr:MAG: biotin--[acetyl-CoA-carboxylase] ligase [Flavobacteriales bacterium]